MNETPQVPQQPVQPPQDNQAPPQTATEQVAEARENPFSWHAPESMAVERGKMWYIWFVLAALALMALAILVLKSITFAILIPVIVAAVFVLSSKPPKVINYAISPKGVYVADKLYDFSEFRSFGVRQDEAYNSAILLPVKRFAPELTIYFTDQEGETIVNMLGSRLPMQEVRVDTLEKIIRLIKL